MISSEAADNYVEKSINSADGLDNALPLSLQEFLKKDIPPLEYYVKDILPKKGKAMISASPNLGKSIFVQNMALAMASGASNFMNKFETLPARVLYLDLEMGESALKERFQKMYTASSTAEDNLFVQHVPKLDLLDYNTGKIIENWINELKIQVVILDPLGSAWFGNENDQEEVHNLTAYLNTLIDKYNISILLVHHWRKASKEFRSGGQMAAGSYRWEAWTDCHVTLEGQSSSTTISCHKNRNRPKFAPFLAKLNETSLCFEFITDYQKKHTENTLEALFESFKTSQVSIPDLIKRAHEEEICSETTLRKLIEESLSFKVNKASKTHYLERKTDEIV